jgi:hypothetical protein
MRTFARLALIFALNTAAFVTAFAAVPVTATKTVSIPLTFERNDGQVPRQFHFVARHGGLEALFSANGVDLIVPDSTQRARRIEMRPCFAVSAAGVQAEKPLSGRANYLRGQHAENWITAVPTFGQLRYSSVYPGIDLLFHGDSSGVQLENDFVVAPGADPKSIRFAVTGADSLSFRADGDMVILVGDRSLVLHRPVAYQEGQTGRALVAAAFRLSDGNVVSFAIGSYDRTQPLTIDPVLSFATYLDGSGTDHINALATDAQGNLYAAGSTSSTDFPVAGAEQRNAAGMGDAFIAKLDPTGHSLIYATYLGGSNVDEAESIAVDGNGNVAVSGTTDSSDFPLTGKLPATSPGNFIASLDATGANLRYSGFLGRMLPVEQESYMRLNRVVFDKQGNAYVAGKTDDQKFLLTPGAYGAPVAPYPDADTLFIAKVQPDGSLGYAATIPETPAQSLSSQVHTIDLGNIAVDSAGEVIVGGTAGTNFPTTTGTLSPSFPNSTTPIAISAGYALKLNAAGSSLVFSTYLPGTDQVNDVSLDGANNIYLAGLTRESTLPTSGNALQKTLIPRNSVGYTTSAGFVLKLSSDGTTASAATYFGGTSVQGSGGSAIDGIVLDPNGNVDIAGTTGAADLPLKNPLLSVENEGEVFWVDTGLFLAQLSGDLSTLQFGSFLSANDAGAVFQAITTNASGKFILSGSTFSKSFPTTPGSFQASPPAQPNPLSTSAMNFIAGIDVSVPAPSMCFDTPVVNFGSVLVNTTATATVNITNCGNAALTLANAISSDPAVTVTQTCSAIAVGGSCQLQFVYAPTTTGSMAGTAVLSGNTAISPQVLSFSGTGTSPQVPLPPSIDFGDLLVGQTGAVNGLNLGNVGTGPFILTGASVTGDFQIIQNTCDVPVAKTKFCNISINFSPTAPGTRTGVLTLTDNLNPTVQTIPLTGNGLTSALAPTIWIIPAVLGGPSATGPLMVYGTGFFPNSTILWNGSPRTTHYKSEATLTADLSAADLEQLGEAQVTVVTPAPGGGTSAPATATIYGRLNNIQTVSEVFEPHSQLIFATVAKTSPVNANSVVAIDPSTMQVTKTLLTGNGPDSLAVSDDGSLLYVGLDDILSVTQISLPGGTQNFTLRLPAVSLPINDNFPNIVASALTVIPGQPHTWLVGFCTTSSVPCGLGVSVFDDATLRPTQAINYDLKADSFVFVNDPTVMYSTEFDQLPPDISAYKITSSGVTRTTGSAFLPSVGGSTLKSDGSLIYDASGQAIDPATLTTRMTYSQANGAFALDSANQRLYFAGPAPVTYGYTYPGTFLFSAVGQTTANTIGQILFQEENSAFSMERFGANGIAIRQSNQWLFLKTSLTGITIPILASSVTPGSLSFGPQTQGTTSAVQQVTLTNHGTAALAVSGISTTGDYAETNNCGASLAVSTSCVINVSFTPTATGDRSGQLSIAGNAPGSPQIVSLDGAGAASAPVVSISVSPSALSFGNQTQGATTATQQVTLQNTGTAALAVSAISVTGDYAETHTCGASVPVAASCVINVSFTPTATGDRTGQLTITDNAPGSPQTVSLDGTGAAPAAPITLSTPSAGGDSATVSSGATATYNLTVTTPAYSGTVMLSCTGAPTNATCTVNPASANVIAGKPTPVVVTVATASSTQSAVLAGPPSRLSERGRAMDRACLGLASLLSLPVLFSLRRRWKHFVVLALFGINITVGVIGCGGGSSAQTVSPTSVVTPGTYKLTITASANNQNATQVLTLTVN